MKETIEKVLFYEKSYDDEVSDYIDEKTFNEYYRLIFQRFMILLILRFKRVLV